tara:strand:+ start:610 stop:1962 length:1353 start_codon:yes stop_codon:yes gene_type:complete
MIDSSQDLRRYRIAKYFIWLNLLISILLLGVSFYKSEIVFDGERHGKYIKYYIVFTSFFILWVILLRKSAKIQYIFIKYYIAIIVAFYAAEIVIAFEKSDRHLSNRIETAKQSGVEFDEREKFVVYQELLNQGVDAAPHFQPTTLVGHFNSLGNRTDDILPLGGISHKTTVAQNENGKHMIFKSDRFGFNNPDQVWDAKKIEWLLTGDSFAQGIAVQPGQDIGGQIRILTKKNVINLGMSGNGPLMELAALKEYAESQKPQTVLWLYFEGNDLVGDLIKERTSVTLMHYLDPEYSQNLIGRQNEIDAIISAHIKNELTSRNRLSFGDILKLSNIREILIHNQNYITIDPLFFKIIKEAQVRVSAWGGRMFFVYLPQYERYSNELQDHHAFRERSEVIRTVKELQVPVLDMHEEVFANQADPKALFPFKLPGHYSAEGYKKIAQALVAAIP